MNKYFLTSFFILIYNLAFGQGLNHQWLLGSANQFNSPKGRMLIDLSSYLLQTEFRKMPFKGTQGNISDSAGSLLMASNGVWVANAIGDTMLNGSDINPNGITNNWPNGLPYISNNLFIPYPDSTNLYIMFHHTITNVSAISAHVLELYYSVIDISLDSGLGGIASKNNIAFSDTLNTGIGSCKHANGRDWWIVMSKDSSDKMAVLEVTPTGVGSVSYQSLNYFPLSEETVSQLTFSQQGDKFISTTYDNPIDRNSSIVIADFDRCTGTFSNTITLQLTNGSYLWGLAFSPNGQFAYATSSNYIFQVDLANLSVDTVAIYDGFISPGPSCCPSTFFHLYLAANGKIYVSSPSGIRHITVINQPDSAGILCDVQQHSIDLVDYLYLSSVPHHPNYYLGCDTTSSCQCLTTDIKEISEFDFHLGVSPNPSNGILNVTYLLPQNEIGELKIHDISGRSVFERRLSQWSTLQSLDLSFLGSGLYVVEVSSGHSREFRKFIMASD